MSKKIIDEDYTYSLFFRLPKANDYVLIPNMLNVSELEAKDYCANNQFDMRKDGIELYVGIGNGVVEPVDVVWDLVKFN